MKNNKEEKLNEKEFEDNVFEKFPKPRTMPMKWDVSELTPSKSETDHKKNDSDEIFEKFPKPRTMPAKWDTSDFQK